MIRTHRRKLLTLPLLAALPRIALAQGFVPTAQDKADLARVESYLNGLTTLKARFLQVAPDGSTAGGIAWLERPGRMRFQYDPPSPLLLVAGHGLVVFYDKQLDQTTNIPIGTTPLGILLAAHLTLSGPVSVVGMQRQTGQLQVTLRRTASPGDGTLTLVFSDPPLALRQWVVVDAQRQETRVTLFDVQLGGSFDPQMFVFINPHFMPGANKTYQ
jgi:outer membrane lipoprotein-sorting protein